LFPPPLRHPLPFRRPLPPLRLLQQLLRPCLPPRSPLQPSRPPRSPLQPSRPPPLLSHPLRLPSVIFRPHHPAVPRLCLPLLLSRPLMWPQPHFRALLLPVFLLWPPPRPSCTLRRLRNPSQPSRLPDLRLRPFLSPLCLLRPPLRPNTRLRLPLWLFHPRSPAIPPLQRLCQPPPLFPPAALMLRLPLLPPSFSPVAILLLRLPPQPPPSSPPVSPPCYLSRRQFQLPTLPSLSTPQPPARLICFAQQLPRPLLFHRPLQPPHRRRMWLLEPPCQSHLPLRRH
jgi:hypothetical protein